MLLNILILFIVILIWLISLKYASAIGKIIIKLVIDPIINIFKSEENFDE